LFFIQYNMTSGPQITNVSPGDSEAR